MKPRSPVRTIFSKIKSPQSLQRLLSRAHQAKSKVVFTNGCFDILHKGHVTYLQQARRQGQILVVALNTDASVRKLKGPSRPINPLADRLEVLAALECVDYVTWFNEQTPLKLILALRPSLLVKGGDWKPKDIVGSKEVVQWGGKAKSIPYVPGRSTTQIIKKAALRSSK